MAEHSIVVESYGPLSPLLRHPTGGPIKPVLERIAARLSKETGKDVDAAMALLLWTRAKGVVAVTASGNSDRIHKLALTQELPDLTAEEVSEIEQLGRKIHFRAYVRSPLFIESVRLGRGSDLAASRTSTCASTSRPPPFPRTSRAFRGELSSMTHEVDRSCKIGRFVSVSRRRRLRAILAGASSQRVLTRS